MSANDRQIGGEHYKSQLQHWDFVNALQLDYFQGQITKYITRARKKNGKQDLEKAMHYLQKYQEIVAGWTINRHPARILEFRHVGHFYFEHYCLVNELTEEEKGVIWLVISWARPHELASAEECLLNILDPGWIILCGTCGTMSLHRESKSEVTCECGAPLGRPGAPNSGA